MPASLGLATASGLGPLFNKEQLMLGFDPIGFADSNFADGPEGRKSVSNGVLFLHGWSTRVMFKLDSNVPFPCQPTKPSK